VPADSRPAPEPKPAARRLDDRTVLAVVLSIPLACTLAGLPYYLLSRAERVRSPAHEWFRPSGVLGLGFGIVALALFLFMWLYPLRKKFRWLAFTGPVGEWLRVHIVVGLALPFLVAVHAGWRFEGLIGLGYGAMVLVSLSGIVGRYLYVHIPRSRNGVELSMEEVAGERRSLLTRVAAATGLDPGRVERILATDPRSYEGLGPLRTIVRMVQDDWVRGRAAGELRRQWENSGRIAPGEMSEVLRLARREMALRQQARMLEAARRVFGLWHVLHRPVAITALLAVLIHVAVAVVVGATFTG
jgi:hypothetical protein